MRAMGRHENFGSVDIRGVMRCRASSGEQYAKEPREPWSGCRVASTHKRESENYKNRRHDGEHERRVAIFRMLFAWVHGIVERKVHHVKSVSVSSRSLFIDWRRLTRQIVCVGRVATLSCVKRLRL